jgi:hypothetical protein
VQAGHCHFDLHFVRPGVAGRQWMYLRDGDAVAFGREKPG